MRREEYAVSTFIYGLFSDDTDPGTGTTAILRN
jgi:hypothetical protein